MEVQALKDNKTLHITKGYVYEACIVSTSSDLVIVENDVGDDVVISRYNFEEEEKKC